MHRDITPDLMPYGWYFSLINYRLDGSIISITSLADAELFMSYRIHEAYLEEDLLKITELDYEATGPIDNPYVLNGESTYVSNSYFRLQKDGTFKNVQYEFYPFDGLIFINEEGNYYRFNQNEGYFSVSYHLDKKSAGTNMDVISEKDGTLTFIPYKGKKIKALLNKDTSTLSVNMDGKIIEYRLKPE